MAPSVFSEKSENRFGQIYRLRPFGERSCRGLSEVSTARAARARRAHRSTRPGDPASGIRAMAEEPPRGDAPPASGDADARTRVSQVSLGSSIPEAISADISEMPLAATRDSTEGGLLDASALAPASLEMWCEHWGLDYTAASG